MTERRVVGFPSLQDGDGTKRALGTVRTQVQQCAVCRGGGQLDRYHAFWEYTVRSPYDRKELPPPPLTVIKLQARQLYEEHQGRCPGCGGSGRVIITYRVHDNGTLEPTGVLHYHPNDQVDDLAYLKKINPQG